MQAVNYIASGVGIIATLLADSLTMLSTIFYLSCDVQIDRTLESVLRVVPLLQLQKSSVVIPEYLPVISDKPDSRQKLTTFLVSWKSSMVFGTKSISLIL